MADFALGCNLIRKLGDGARSTVFQVVRPETGEVFALKRVTRGDHEDTRFLDQAIHEHEIASRLDHPFLRRSLEIRCIRRLFKRVAVEILMEFVDGVGLDKCRPDRIEKSVDLLLKVARGLDHMHEAGYLHTDIKPNNILVSYDGGVRIIDFGQSCEIGFRKPRIQGTPDYIAPEQVGRHRLTRQTDIFNLGATLYWALTGRAYPTVIGGKGRRQRAERRPPPPSPQELNPKVPEDLSRLVMECCQYDRSMRPKDMGEVIVRLEQATRVLAAQPDAAPGGTTGSTPTPGGGP